MTDVTTLSGCDLDRAVAEAKGWQCGVAYDPKGAALSSFWGLPPGSARAYVAWKKELR